MKLATLVVASVAAMQLSGCLVIIPGSVTGAVSDAITGAEGAHCVGANAKVGDIISLPGGGRGQIKSLSGTSIRCQQPEHPIRALLAFDNVGGPQTKKGCDLQKDENGDSKLVCPQ